MDSMDKSVQHRSILALPITVQQDTPKGSWVTATGTELSADALPFGITQYEAMAGQEIAVTVLGTASMNLDGIANAVVMQGDAICFDAGAMNIKPATDAVATPQAIHGIVLYDSAATGHAEVLLR